MIKKGKLKGKLTQEEKTNEDKARRTHTQNKMKTS